MLTRMVGEEVIGAFAGYPNPEFERAKIVLVPVAFDGTTSYKAGARHGGEAILTASRQIDEIWGEEHTHPMIADGFFYTWDLIKPWGASTKEKLDSVYLKIWHEVALKNKIPFLLGGEHSLAYSNIKAAYHGVADFSILHLDAHPDLRHSLEGDFYSHSCALRRAFELGPRVSLTSFGIRSVDLDVREYIERQMRLNTPQKSLNIFYAKNGIYPTKICDTLKEKVYITLDVDGFDCSFMSSAGTPQPGGCGWYEVINLLERIIKDRDIIGLDVVELAPVACNHAPDFSAAKLVFYILEALYEKFLPHPA